MANNQPHTKRDVGGQGDKSKDTNGNPAKNQPGKTSDSRGKERRILEATSSSCSLRPALLAQLIVG